MNGKIYKIVKQWNIYWFYCSSYEILKYGDYKIELLEDYPFVDLKDLQKREGWYQLNNIALLIAGYRPIDIININEKLLYHCICCKLLICNTYPKRLLHLRTSAHRKNRNNIHKNIVEIL